MPILIVEIEQRHIRKEINEVFESIESINYKGFFLKNGILKSINQYEYKKHQKPFLENVNSKEYINNFIFIPNFKITGED